jgi:hypothetical protein
MDRARLELAAENRRPQDLDGLLSQIAPPKRP